MFKELLEIDVAEIFISYRRKDTVWAAGRIGDRLRLLLDEKTVFFDSITIEPGANFVETIGDHIEECRVLLVLIGPLWANELQRRLKEPNDFVRHEVEQALLRGIRLIPIVVDDTSIPTENDLPSNLQCLASLNAVRIKSESFEADIAFLAEFLKKHLNAIPFTTPIKPDFRPTSETSTPNIGLQHTTKFWKTGKSGKPLHRIFVSLDASQQDLAKVSKVIYYLHPTFKNPVREIIDRRQNFELQTNGWGNFEIKAEIYLNDNSEPQICSHLITIDN